MKIEDLAKNHSYHCDNYASGYLQERSTWSSFLDEMRNADDDLNLLFRWDIKENEDEGDGYSMFLYFMHQRKGRFVPFIIDVVTDDDAQGIYDYLQKKWQHLAKLWDPVFALDVLGVE